MVKRLDEVDFPLFYLQIHDLHLEKSWGPIFFQIILSLKSYNVLKVEKDRVKIRHLRLSVGWVVISYNDR